MGCDIHLHTEAWHVDGTWQHFGAPNIQRDYGLFAKLAGVRGDPSLAISPPKGVPDDLSLITKLDLRSWAGDAHSHSYLYPEEIQKVCDWYEESSVKRLGHLDYLERQIGYFFGNCWGTYAISDLDPGIPFTAVRWVFWFDS